MTGSLYDLFDQAGMRLCALCGRSFEVPIRRRGRPAVYCGATCSDLAAKVQRRRWRAEAAPVACIVCSGPLDLDPNREAGRLPRYCSPECRLKGRLRKRRALAATRLTR